MDIHVSTHLKSQSSAEEIFQQILTSKGYRTKKAQDLFLHPREPNLAFLLKESKLKKTSLAKSQKLLDSHLHKNHDICIFGDYDADGVTATAIMWQAVSAYAKQSHSSSRVLPFIPDRHRHGYGLGSQAISEVTSGSAFRSAQFGAFVPKLIITVDTGIVAISGIKAFRAADIDVIITDHHQLDSTLPSANCILHTTATSGAGVAWIFAMYLLEDSGLKLLDLATIGIIADMMPLTGLNRSVCTHGLQAVSTTRRPGLLALKTAMGIADQTITTHDISFGIAPRINAAGRIYNPLDALRLLCTSNPQLAIELATKIESHNRDRQELTDHALALATSQPVKHNIIVILGDYHEGVIGLVAGKLTEIYHRPAVVMSDGGEVIKGSARSIPGVNITDLLRSLHTPFLGLGGHDQAAGFSLSHDQVVAMTRELEGLADKNISSDLLVPHHFADFAISLVHTSLALAKLIHTMEPFGIGNPKPKFLLHDLTVLEDRQLGEGGKHRKLTVEQDGLTRELMLFNSALTYPLKFISTVVCTLDVNVWKTRESLQLIGSYVET